MNTNKKFTSLLLLVMFSLFIFSNNVSASTVPTLSLSFVDSSNVRVAVNGDPNSSIELHFGPGAVATNIIGVTDSSGNFSTLLGAQTYDLAQCNQTAYVIIGGAQSTTIPWSSTGSNTTCSTASSGGPSFSQNNLVLNPGQNFSVLLTGSGGYSISSNSNPNIISASINGNQVSLYATSFGGSNLTICQSDGGCSILYVVAVNGNVTQTTSSVTLPAAISSFTVSSNDANGYFMGAGNLLTFTFGTNEQIGNVSITVGGSHIGISGSGNGPYTGTYTLSGNEGSPIPVVVNFADLDGRLTSTTFELGGASASSQSNIVSTPVSITATPVVSTKTVGDSYVFSKLISINSKGSEVTELQKRLTALGFYSGPINGNFGPLTEVAVKKLQKGHGINQAGYVGPSTRAILNQ